MVLFDEDKQNKRINDLRKQEEEELAQTLSSKYGIPYLDLSVTPINIDSLRVIGELETREAQIGVFNDVNKVLSIGAVSPNNPKTVEAIDKLKSKGYAVQLFMVSHAGLSKVWDRYKDLSYSFETKSGALDISNEQITEFLDKVHTIPDVQKLISEILLMKKSYRISRIMEIILAGAMATGSSDIHLEPEEEYVTLRYRLDGMLTEVLKFDTETYKLLLSRIKLVSNLKLNVGNAQDGRFSIKVAENEIEIRTSMIPGAYGDSVVMRVLNPNAISVPLESLGIHPRLLKIILHEMSRPSGLLLNTGPTGSGKTTSLYAFLKKIHTPDIKIITIENPIEYHLPGIVQTQTDEKKNYTFVEGLRSALRQDPDVIMVGEIRDKDTAEIAVNSALTGHLVFSTLHTNTAAGTFPRLIDLGINPKIISSALNLAMAQRLVRKLCSVCKKQIKLEGRNKEIVDKVLLTLNDKTYLDGIDVGSEWQGVGCDKCNMTGYKGRIGVYEAIMMDENIERVVAAEASEREIKKVAISQNILDLRQDGIIKVLQGVTTIEELERIIDLEKE
ncbi:Flp pilus assembly complex ATPase component TadA [Patescibacteria group bacterium]|nr:Flp pilus assembly complex ATPase component TadA [Patescibacteria group bacterium]